MTINRQLIQTFKVYQNTKIDTQRHTTQSRGEWKCRLGTVSDTCHWGIKARFGRQTSHIFHSRPLFS